MKGRVKFYDENKGYGFITDEEGRDHYVAKTLAEERQLKTGDEVCFMTEEQNGKSRVREIESVRHEIPEQESGQKKKEPSVTPENSGPEEFHDTSEGISEKDMELLLENEKEENRKRREAIDSAVRQENNKKGIIKNFFHNILEKLKKLGKSIVRPISWLGDQIAILTIPKEVKGQMYNEALNQARNELQRQQENAMKEDTHALLKKNEILRSEKTDAEKVIGLAKLAYNSRKRIIAPTVKGALMFERVEDSVLIKHANPVKRTAESKEMTYGFKTVGALEFNRRGKIKAEHDIDLVLREVAMDGSFNKTETSIPENVNMENTNNYGNDTKTETPVEMEEVDEHIYEGNREEIKETILDAIDIPDREADDENLERDAVQETVPDFSQIPIPEYIPEERIPDEIPDYSDLPIAGMKPIPERHAMDVEDIIARYSPIEEHTDNAVRPEPEPEQER